MSKPLKNLICKIFGHKSVTVQTFQLLPKAKLYKPSTYCRRCNQKL